MINKVLLLGNLGGDPQVKFTKDGAMMVVFRIATSEYVRNNGTYEKFTEWHTVYAFGKLAEFCSKLKKGDRVFIEGKIRNSVFESDKKVFRVSNIVAKVVKLIPRGTHKHEMGIEITEPEPESEPEPEEEEFPLQQPSYAPINGSLTHMKNREGFWDNGNASFDKDEENSNNNQEVEVEEEDIPF